MALFMAFFESEQMATLAVRMLLKSVFLRQFFSLVISTVVLFIYTYLDFSKDRRYIIQVRFGPFDCGPAPSLSLVPIFLTSPMFSFQGRGRPRARPPRPHPRGARLQALPAARQGPPQRVRVRVEQGRKHTAAAGEAHQVSLRVDIPRLPYIRYFFSSRSNYFLNLSAKEAFKAYVRAYESHSLKQVRSHRDELSLSLLTGPRQGLNISCTDEVDLFSFHFPRVLTWQDTAVFGLTHRCDLERPSLRDESMQNKMSC